jgi:hypothetical protein
MCSPLQVSPMNTIFRPLPAELTTSLPLTAVGNGSKSVQRNTTHKR